jgi:hypothetical protein
MFGFLVHRLLGKGEVKAKLNQEQATKAQKGGGEER